MKRAAGAAWLVAKNMIFIGFSVQICLGLVWMAASFGTVQDFPSVTAGVYPLFLRLTGGRPALVCLLQLSFALYAGYRLMGRLCPERARRPGEGAFPAGLPCRGLTGAGFRLWGSLALMTLPMALQCHMALIPQSFVASLALLQLSFVCEAGAGEDSCAETLLRCLVCYAAQGQLWPEYWIPGAVLPLLLFLRKLPGMRREREQFRKGLLFFLCFLALAVGGCGSQWRETAGGGDISGWRWMLVKRFCWPTLWVDFADSSGEWNLSSSDVIWRSAYYPGNMDTILRPALEEALAEGAAEEVLWGMARTSWEKHRSMIVRQVGWDVLGYGVTPLILPIQLRGEAYDSCSGRNYEMMLNSAPLFTKYYVRLSCGWFAAYLVLGAAGILFFYIASRGRTRAPQQGAPVLRAGGSVGIRSLSGRAAPVLIALCSAGAVICFFTMRGAGIMDYKYTVWINQLWIAAGIKIIVTEESADGVELSL